jgi:protein-tyrosine phosphatase
VIDLHSHLLPGVDDGATDLAVAIAMLDAAAAIGIGAIVATPHLTSPLDAGYAHAVGGAFDSVLPEARRRGIELTRGFEIRLTPDVPARLADGEPSALGDSRWVLVDLPFVDEWPHFVDATLFAIQTAGYGVILAHPERYPRIQREPDLGRALAERGVALQVTAGSFAGIFGRRAKRAAEALLEHGAVHLVATDAHSAGQRMAAVPAGLRRLESLVGSDGYRTLTVDAPAAVLAGEPLPAPVAANRRSLLDRLLPSR